MSDIVHAIIVFPVSIWLIVIGIRRMKMLRRIKKKRSVAKGFVYDMNGTKPIIRFITSDDKWITGEHAKAGVFEKGDTLRVVYNPANPEEFYIQNFATKITPWLLISGSVICVTFGVLALLHIIPWHT